MKYTNFLIFVFCLLPSFSACAITQIPFGGQVDTIKNYNRATSLVATSGIIGKQGAEILSKHGFKTIIDLRTRAEGTDEEKLAAKKAGISYINIPITGNGISRKQAAAFTNVIENAETPALIHCASGNRAGAMWAAYRISKGIAPAFAIEAGRAAGMGPGMEQKVRDVFID